MERNIYVFDEYLTSQKNGIGTYLQEFIYCLKYSEWTFTKIIFNAETEEFTIIEKSELREILFPTFHDRSFLNLGHIIHKLLRLHIKDSSQNIFFVNHAPCGLFLESLKKEFPLSKICYTIHDFTWTMPLMGNLEIYKKMTKDIADNNQISCGIVQLYEEDKRMYELVDKIICLSKDTYDIVRKIYKIPSAKVAYIPNGLRCIRTNFFKKDETRINFHLRTDEKNLLYVGRPTKQKGLFDLIAAMDIVLKYYPNTKLIIVGEPEPDMTEILKVSSAHSPSIIFTGLLNKVMLGKWLSIADIGVIPSYYEQCSYTAIEMMMYGIPIVASNGLGLRNMFQDGINAKIAKIGNRNHPKRYQKNIAFFILELLKSEELRERMGINAEKRYQNKYNIETMKKLYMELIHELFNS